MQTQPVESPNVKDLRSIKRKSVTLSQGGLIKIESLPSGAELPLVIKPAVKDLDLISWASTCPEFIQTNLMRHGGLLFRNFDVPAVSKFEQFIKTISGEALEYKERSSPRRQVGGNIYTSTDYPPNQKIFVHNENSYQKTWPLKIFFYCETPPQGGGETPIASCRNLLRRLDPRITERFVQKKWMYVRNFGDGFGLPWQSVFQTTDRAQVEQHCRQNGIEVEWKPDNRLRVRAVRQALTTHPYTRETVWFNHATFFNVSTLEPGIRELLRTEFQEEDLPINSYYGDGSRIEDSVLGELRALYLEEEINFPWQRGDILMLDNMLVAHGRAPFSGARKILVGMSEPFTQQGV
jgi:alpha-ketoglutarate-dependent taurine dioxygenase